MAYLKKSVGLFKYSASFLVPKTDDRSVDAASAFGSHAENRVAAVWTARRIILVDRLVKTAFVRFLWKLRNDRFLHARYEIPDAFHLLLIILEISSIIPTNLASAQNMPTNHANEFGANIAHDNKPQPIGA